MSVFKAYDVRGIFPDELDVDLVRRIGWAFATYSRSAEIVVGRDMRTSGEALSHAFIEGARSAGTAVVDIGLVSTDVVYFASGRLGLPGAMLTASHNPAQYNGIKFCLSGAAPVGQDTGLGDIERLTQGAQLAAEIRGQVRQLDILHDFSDYLLSLVDPASIEPLTVAIDTANGMGGLVVPAVLGRLSLNIVPLYFELDGRFPNHPADPIQPENLRDLQQAVTSSGADLGLAFDGDADRVFLVDERARLVSGSLTTALVAQALLQRSPGETVIHNAICSRVVAEVVREHGGTPVRSRVGHSFIKQLMAETGAVFGGEHSGHYYFRDNFRADSGLLAALYVLETMSKARRPLSELLAPLQRYSSSGEINLRVRDQRASVGSVAAHYRDVEQDDLDGLTVSDSLWWCNVRASNTEPLLRVNIEARTEELMVQRRDEIVALIQGA